MEADSSYVYPGGYPLPSSSSRRSVSLGCSGSMPSRASSVVSSRRLCASRPLTSSNKGGNSLWVKAVSQRASPVDVKAHSTFPQYQLLTIRTQRKQPVRVVAPSLIHGGMVLQQIIPSLQGTGKQAVPPGMGTGGEGRPERLPCFVHDMQVRYFHGR